MEAQIATTGYERFQLENYGYIMKTNCNKEEFENGEEQRQRDEENRQQWEEQQNER
jgi:hypothetical protein